MNNKLIQQYGEEILSYRIRSARHKKRMQYEDFDRKLRRMHKQERALYKIRSQLGWKLLTPPFQRGWTRFFVLRDDVAVSRKAAFFAGILAKINTTDWSHRKDFMVKYRRFGTKKYRVKTKKLLEPDEHQFAKLGFSEAEKRFFYAEARYEGAERGFVFYYVFNEPWRFRLQVKPNMVVKAKVINDGLESEIHQIHNWINRNNLQYRQYKVMHQSLWWTKDYRVLPWERNPLKNKPVVKILNELEEDV